MITTTAGASSSSRENSLRLDALTSLRFLAAMLVLTSHAVPVFISTAGGTLEQIPLAQGVSFFFVLSGFILAHVHPTLNGVQDSLKFLRARIARVYPGYLFAAALSLGFSDIHVAHMNTTSWQILTSNLLMLQSWVPQARFFFSINPPGWSISTELFFYFMFLWLIQKLEKRWIQNLLLAALCLLGCMVFSIYMNLPALPMADSPSMRALIYISPLARLFEFCLGMACNVIYKKLVAKNFEQKFSTRDATVLELLVLGAIGVYMSNIWFATYSMQANSFQLAVREWLVYDGNCFSFAALIILCALQKGAFSKLMLHRPMVWLGEISYSLYLLHFVLLTYYRNYSSTFDGIDAKVLLAGYLVVTIFAAYVSHKFIEVPLRKLIVSSGKVRPITV